MLFVRYAKGKVNRIKDIGKENMSLRLARYYEKYLQQIISDIKDSCL